jgi:serine/threonine protein phosphatase PrpC
VSDLINDLFSGKKENDEGEITPPPSSELPTQPYDSGLMESITPPAAVRSFQIGTASSIGIQRDHNEDALFAMSTVLISNRIAIPAGLFIVADGMGGHEHGEKASELAVQAMAGSVMPQLMPPALGLEDGTSEKQLKEIMSKGVHSAHKSIQENASGGGSTLTGLLILGKTVTIAHIGDSRAYHFDSQHDPRVLTTDHSLVKRLEDLGQITPDEAATHPQRNVLYRALGQVEHVDADLISTALPSSGHLMVCSDGLWGLVSDQEMYRVIVSTANPQEASQQLIKAANAAGGPDNITVIIIQIPA